MSRNSLPDFGWRSWLGSFLLIAQFLFASDAFAQATSTAERFFSSDVDAQSACVAEPVQYFCGPMHFACCVPRQWDAGMQIALTWLMK